MSALGYGTDARERAKMVYYRAHEEGIQQRRALEAVAGASVYVTLQQMSIPVSIDELDPLLQVDRNRVLRTAKVIVRELSLKIEPEPPDSYLPKYSSALGVSMETQQRAESWIDQNRTILSSHSPAKVAATALYAASKTREAKDLQQQEIVEQTPISRKHLSELWPKISPNV